jgi:nucleoside-diphosphate-sugar epimerase
MNVLVLGGTRYFGKRLVRQLLLRGHRVTVASRRAMTATFEGAPLRIELSRDDADAMRSHFSGREYDVVVDQICMTAAQAGIAIETFRSTVRRYVMTSSINVYDANGTALPEKAFDPSSARPSWSARMTTPGVWSATLRRSSAPNESSSTIGVNR